MSVFLRSIRRHWRPLKRWRRRLRLKQLARGAPRRVIVGAGGTTQIGWISTDIDELNLLAPHQWRFYFAVGSIDAILAEHVWEHLTLEDGRIAARTCFDFLKPGGYLRIAVPDGYHPNPQYIERVRPLGTGPGADDHKVLYTHPELQKLLETVGFSVRLLEYFDRNGRFHGCDWSAREGMVYRSRHFDPRNQVGQLNYTSLIADAQKPPRD